MPIRRVGTLPRVAGRSKTPSTRPSRAERRAQLLDAAVEAVRTVGAGASMEQLAGQAGVTKPILYRHFGDREGLVRALAERFVATLLERLDAAMETPAGADLLWRTVDAYLAFLEEDPQLYAFLTSSTAGRAGLEGANAVIDAVARRVAVVVGDQLRAQGLDAGGAEPYAYGVVGMVHQAGDWWIHNRTMSREALTTYLATLLSWGFEGLGRTDGAGGG